MVTFGEAIRLGYSNSFNFSGVSKRSEYWWFFLFQMLVGFFGVVLMSIFEPMIFLVALFVLVTLPANIAIQVRRIRDAGGSMLWLFGLWGGAFAQSAFAVAMVSTTTIFTEGSQVASPWQTPMMIASGVYTICALVCFVYTLLPSKD